MKLNNDQIKNKAKRDSYNYSFDPKHGRSYMVGFENGAKWARDKACEWVPVSELPEPDRFSMECGSYYRDFIAIQDYDGAIDFATYEKFPNDEKGVFHAFNQTLGEDEVRLCKIIEPPKSE